MARPDHVYDPKIAAKVEALTVIGLPLSFVSIQVDLCPNSIKKYYSEHILECKEDRNTMVANSLFHQAVHKGNVTAIIFWLKCQAKWKEAKDADETIADMKEAFLKAIAPKLPE